MMALLGETSPRTRTDARIIDQGFLMPARPGANSGITVDEIASFGIALTLGCGQSVPRSRGRRGLDEVRRANGTASWNGGPPTTPVRSRRT